VTKVLTVYRIMCF